MQLQLAEKVKATLEIKEKLRMGYRENMTHLAAIDGRSYLALHAAVLYRAYRLRQRSHDIATELGVTHTAVRQWLFRANQSARRLGYECFSERHWTHGRKVKWVGMRKHVVKLPQEKPRNKAAD